MKTFNTLPAQLAPIPAAHPENRTELPAPAMEDFVDEEVIASMLAMPSSRKRFSSNASDLVLSSDENDFAGFTLRENSPFHAIAEKQEHGAIPNTPWSKRPPAIQPQRKNHRWWIPATTGAACAIILSLVYINLAHPEVSEKSIDTLAKSYRLIESAITAFSSDRY